MKERKEESPSFELQFKFDEQYLNDIKTLQPAVPASALKHMHFFAQPRVIEFAQAMVIEGEELESPPQIIFHKK